MKRQEKNHCIQTTSGIPLTERNVFKKRTLFSGPGNENNGSTCNVDYKNILNKSGVNAALYHSSGSIHFGSLCYSFVKISISDYDN